MTAKVLITNGANVEMARDNGMTPLSVAAENGHVEVVKVLLDFNASAESKDHSGETPRDKALRQNSDANREVLRILDAT